ncbi:MAG: diguanylate cyclase [Pyrinomonadaceae bacterium]
MSFDKTQKDQLVGCVTTLMNVFSAELYQPIADRFSMTLPEDLKQIQQDLNSLRDELERKGVENLNKKYLPYLKLAVQIARVQKAKEQEDLRGKTHNALILEKINRSIDHLSDFIKSQWYVDSDSFVLPAITDYLKLKEAYTALPGRVLEHQPFDAKFGILKPHNSFLPMLQQARYEAKLRGIEISVAFVDIDNFKFFNTTFGEPLIDAQFLPIVMQTIESHVYSHGTGFLFGGDEYVLLLPNMEKVMSLPFLNTLQRKLAGVRIPGITDGITISIGCCWISPSSFLTDAEVIGYANRAMRYAKKWRNCVGYYRTDGFEEQDLEAITSEGHIPRDIDVLAAKRTANED